jgi:hypothetical protein
MWMIDRVHMLDITSRMLDVGRPRQPSCSGAHSAGRGCTRRIPSRATHPVGLEPTTLGSEDRTATAKCLRFKALSFVQFTRFPTFCTRMVRIWYVDVNQLSPANHLIVLASAVDWQQVNGHWPKNLPLPGPSRCPLYPLKPTCHAIWPCKA